MVCFALRNAFVCYLNLNHSLTLNTSQDMANIVDGQFDDAEEDYSLDPIAESVNRLKIESKDDFSSEEEEDWDECDDFEDMSGIKRKGVFTDPNASHNKFESNTKRFEKFENRLNVDKYSIPSKSLNLLNETSRRLEDDRKRVRDKSQRATQQQVLDPKTRIILFKLINRHMIEGINGVISTGKEANVYHANSHDGVDKAVKIYKTSILTFKDRDKYVSGEFRFRYGYCRHNPRKMVRTWAEKEMRNLSRIYQSGIDCPKPYVLRSHVLVMDFIGTNGLPAPLLKDVELSESKARQLYLDCILIMRRLFTVCKLVHSDLSEFNLLYNDSKLYVIDVSQSVESEHPMALEFLRKDCTNVNEFFRKKSIPTMTTKELFDFITDPNINDENIDRYLERAQQIASQRTAQELEELLKVDEEVFKKVYIPQRLEEVVDFESDVMKKDKKEIFYTTITGLRADLTGATLKPSILDDDNDSTDDSNQSAEENSELSDDENTSSFVNSSRPKDESIEEKKV